MYLVRWFSLSFGSPALVYFCTYPKVALVLLSFFLDRFILILSKSAQPEIRSWAWNAIEDHRCGGMRVADGRLGRSKDERHGRYHV